MTDASPESTVPEMSDLQLQGELQLLGELISSNTGRHVTTGTRDGKDLLGQRLDALSSVRALAASGIADRPGFTQLLNSYIKVPILNQLADTRAPVVAAACKLIEALLQFSSSHTAWTAVTTWFTSALLQATASTKKGVEEAAAATLLVMAKGSYLSARFLCEVLKGCQARHANVRAHSTRTLLQLLQHARGSTAHLSLESYTTPIVRVLHSGLEDASPQVRQLMRACYWALHAIEKKAAEELFRSLSSVMKGLLEQERSMASAEICTEALAQPLSRDQQYTRAACLQREPPHTDRRVSDARTLRADIQEAEARRAREVTHNRQSGARRRPLTLSHAKIQLGTPRKTARIAATLSTHKEMDANGWHVLVASIGSSDWSARVDCLQDLSAVLDRLDDDIIKEAVPLLVGGIKDPHFRVCEAALALIRRVATTDRVRLLQPHLHDVLTSLLTLSVHPKPMIESQARGLLTQLLERMEADAILQALLQSLGVATNPKVQVATITTIQYVCEQRAGSVLQSSLRSLVASLVPQLKATKTVRSAAVDALTAFYKAAPVPFVARMLQLSEADQDEVYHSLGEAIPSLRQDCNEYAKHSSSDRRQLSSEAMETRWTPPMASFSLAAPRHACQLPLHESSQSAVNSMSLADLKGPQRTTATTHPSSVSFAFPPAGSVPTTAPATVLPRTSPRHLPTTSATSPLGLRGPNPVSGIVGDTDPARVTTRPVASYDITASTTFLSDYSPHQFVDPYHPNSQHSSRRDVEGPALIRGRPRAGSSISLSTDLNTLVDLLSDTAQTSAQVSRIMYDLLRNVEICPSCITDNNCTRIFRSLAKHCMEQHQPSHTVRRQGFTLLRVMLELRVMRPTIGRQLSRAIRLCRCGVDDAFYEVQQEASLLLHTVLYCCGLSFDLSFNAIATCLEGWLVGSTRDDGTRGWVELFMNVGRLLEGCQQAPQNTSLSTTVVDRVSSVLQRGMEHCNAEVRRIAVAGMATLWQTLGQGHHHYVEKLPPAHKKLVTMYYHLLLSKGQHHPRS